MSDTSHLDHMQTLDRMEAVDRALAAPHIGHGTRTDRVVSWIGWHTLELAPATVALITALTVWPPALAVTVLALASIPAQRVVQAHQQRRRLARRQTTTTETTDVEAEDTEREVRGA